MVLVLVLVLLGAMLVLFSSSPSAPSSSPQETASPAVHPKEVLVVLGQALHADGMPRRGLKRRVLQAVTLWRSRASHHPVVVLSGFGKREGALLLGQEDEPTEASAMRDMARCAGLPENVIWMEEQASNTAENAYYSAQLLLTQVSNLTDHLERVTVVTSDWHTPRARLVFEAFIPPVWDLHVVGVPDSSTRDREARDLALMPATLRDLSALPPSSAIWNFALRGVLEELAWNEQVVVAAAPGVTLSNSIQNSEKCACGDDIAVIVWGERTEGVTLCQEGSFRAAVFESNTQHARGLREGTSLRRGPPMSSSSWAYRIECVGSDKAGANKVPAKLAEKLTCFRIRKTRPY